jgi:hypothetical protein
VARWLYRDAHGSELGHSDPFASQAEAEAFMARAWAELYDRGVRTVVLVVDGQELYDMSLEAG